VLFDGADVSKLAGSLMTGELNSDVEFSLPRGA
jgi:hypothetical protein